METAAAGACCFEVKRKDVKIEQEKTEFCLLGLLLLMTGLRV